MELNIDKTGWKKVKFGEVCRQVNETARSPQEEGLIHVVGLEHIGSNDLHIRSWNTLERETTFTRKFVKGQVLFGRRRAYQAKVAYAEFDGICSGDILVFEAIKSKLLPELLPFMVQSQKFYNKAVETSAGSLSPRTKFKDLADLEFLLPPKDQQARLAELLWAADDVVEREMEVKERLENASQLYFDQICNTKKQKSKLGECLIVKKKKSKPPHQIEKYLGLEHIKNGEFTTTEFSSSKDILADSYIFEKGDLLYSKLRPYLDKAIIADFDGICTTELIIYDTNSKAIKEYILYVLHSKDFLNYIVGKGFGTKMPRVSHEIVSDYDCYLPSIEEQILILDSLSKFKKSKFLQNEQIETGLNLKQGLINEIF